MGEALSSKPIGLASIQVFLVIVAGAALQFLFYVLLARGLGVDLFGIFAFGLSVYTLCLLFVRLSGDTLVLRELSTASDEETVSQIFIFLFVVALSMYVIFICGFYILDYFGLINYRYSEGVRDFLLILPVGVVLRYTMAVARVQGRTLLSQLGDQVVRPLVASGVLLMLSRGSKLDVEEAIFSFAAGVSAALVVTVFPLISINKLIRIIFRMPNIRMSFRSYLKSAATITAISGQNIAIKQIDVIFLGVLSVPAVVGSYSVATKIAVLATFMLSAVNMVIAPIMARTFSENRIEDLRKILVQSSRLITVFSLLFWVVVFFLAEHILAYFGPEFREAEAALKILVTAQLINAFFGPVGTLLNMLNREGVAIRILALSFALCIVLNLTLIPLYQEIGAAIAYSTAIITWNVLMAMYAIKYLGLNTTIFQK